jgi:hypothetical protein
VFLDRHVDALQRREHAVGLNAEISRRRRRSPNRYCSYSVIDFHLPDLPFFEAASQAHAASTGENVVRHSARQLRDHVTPQSCQPHPAHMCPGHISGTRHAPRSCPAAIVDSLEHRESHLRITTHATLGCRRAQSRESDRHITPGRENNPWSVIALLCRSSASTATTTTPRARRGASHQ